MSKQHHKKPYKGTRDRTISSDQAAIILTTLLHQGDDKKGEIIPRTKKDYSSRTRKTVQLFCQAAGLQKDQASDITQSYTKADPDAANMDLDIVLLSEVITQKYPRLKIDPQAVADIIPSGADFLQSFTESPGIRDLVTVCYYRVMAEEQRLAVKRLSKEVVELREKLGKSKTFRMGSHLPEQLLTGPQLSLFEEQIQVEVVLNEKKTVHMDLSHPENMLVVALSKILHHRSQNSRPDQIDYYAGNRHKIPVGMQQPMWTTRPIVKEDPDQRLKTPQLMVTIAELTAEYMGGTYSGADVNHVEKLLNNLASRSFRVTYVREVSGKDSKGKPIKEKQTVDFEAPLIHILSFTQERTEAQGATQTRSTRLIVLNSVFVDQIETKFLLLPDDYVSRLRAAYPGKKKPKILALLGLYLSQVKSGNNEIAPHTIYIDTLLSKLDPKLYKKSRGKALEYTETCLDGFIDQGFISKWEKVPGASGELQYRIYINKKW